MTVKTAEWWKGGRTVNRPRKEGRREKVSGERRKERNREGRREKQERRGGEGGAGKEREADETSQKEGRWRSRDEERLWLNRQDNSVMLRVRCLLSHCSICMWKRHSRARFHPGSLPPALWLADGASAPLLQIPPLLGARELSHGHSEWARHVKRLLLAALAKKTNRGREAHNERESTVLINSAH